MYAQTNYSQIQGINGRYTIHDIGCFLTSFCNLLSRFGKPIDPLSLNNVMRDRGIYIDVDDGIRDDLAWNSITQYDPSLVVTAVGGASNPPHANAIVKFNYKSSRTGNFTTHFSMVEKIENGVVYVRDSWDGAVKPASNYGGVKAYATYEYKRATQPQQGGSAVNDKFTNEAEVKPFYVLLRGDEATLEERKGWVGRPKIDFISSPNTATEARNNAAARNRASTLASQLEAANRDLGTKTERIKTLEGELAAVKKPTAPTESQATEADQADAKRYRNAKAVLKDLFL